MYNKVFADETLLLPPLPEAGERPLSPRNGSISKSSTPLILQESRFGSKDSSPVIQQEGRMASPVYSDNSAANQSAYVLPPLRVGPRVAGAESRPSISSQASHASAAPTSSSHAHTSSIEGAGSSHRGGGILLNANNHIGRSNSTKINGNNPITPRKPEEPLASPSTAKQSQFSRPYSVASGGTERMSDSSEQVDGSSLSNLALTPIPASPPPVSINVTGPGSTAGKSRSSSIVSGSSRISQNERLNGETTPSRGVSPAPTPTPTQKREGLRRFGSLLRR